jgi:hypothetical protein
LGATCGPRSRYLDISTGQVNRIITEGKDVFHQEKTEILRVGLEVSRYVHVDDAGARRILKIYKQSPAEELKAEVSERSDAIFTQETRYESPNQALERIHRNKSELLVVLERPELPLQNNPAEEAVRGYVKKRKISGSTRSEIGRRCRDSSASVKKTCRKLGVPFWHFLKDRVSGGNRIPPLSEMIRQRAQKACG